MDLLDSTESAPTSTWTRDQEVLQILENAAQLESNKVWIQKKRRLKKSSDKPSNVTDGLKDLKIVESIVTNGLEKQNNK